MTNKVSLAESAKSRGWHGCVGGGGAWVRGSNFGVGSVGSAGP